MGSFPLGPNSQGPFTPKSVSLSLGCYFLAPVVMAGGRHPLPSRGSASSTELRQGHLHGNWGAVATEASTYAEQANTVDVHNCMHV